MLKKIENVAFIGVILTFLTFFVISIMLVHKLSDANKQIAYLSEQLQSFQQEKPINNKCLQKENELLKNIVNSVKDNELTIYRGFNKPQLAEMISNVLIYLGEKNIRNYTQLILATSMIESNMGQLHKQIKGPALGIFQMEPRTEKCIWDNYLKYNQSLKKKIEELKGKKINNLSHLQSNLGYSIAMTYIHYKRTGKKPPNSNDKLAIVKFHKKFYNTDLGKSSHEKSLKKIVGI